MSLDNRMTAERIATLEPGATVLIESWSSGWREPTLDSGTVVKLTATQAVVSRTSGRGRSFETRFRRKDGRAVGHTSEELIDPEHPRTAAVLAATERKRGRNHIQMLADRFRRDPNDLDALRKLYAAVSEYLTAAEPATRPDGR